MYIIGAVCYKGTLGIELDCGMYIIGAVCYKGTLGIELDCGMYEGGLKSKFRFVITFFVFHSTYINYTSN